MLSLLAMSGSGCSAIIQKLHQRSEFVAELPSFLTLALLASAAMCFVLHLFLPREAEKGGRMGLRSFAFPAVSGLCIGCLHLMNLVLAGKLPSVIHFPVYNVGSMILTGVLGALIFRERSGRMQIAGFAIGCIAILIVGLC